MSLKLKIHDKNVRPSLFKPLLTPSHFPTRPTPVLSSPEAESLWKCGMKVSSGMSMSTPSSPLRSRLSFSALAKNMFQRSNMQEDDNREEVTVTRTGEAWPQSLRWGTVELHRAPTARWSAAPAPGGSQYLQKEEDLEMGIHQIVLCFFYMPIYFVHLLCIR